jgi:hypothetical protein
MSSSAALAFMQTKKVLKAAGGPGLELLEYDHVFQNIFHREMQIAQHANSFCVHRKSHFYPTGNQFLQTHQTFLFVQLL